MTPQQIREMNAASKCGRVPMPAIHFYNDDTEPSGYIYSPDKDELGLDPWISIVGVDRVYKSNMIILYYGQTGEKIVTPNYKVYVKKKM